MQRNRKHQGEYRKVTYPIMDPLCTYAALPATPFLCSSFPSQEATLEDFTIEDSISREVAFKFSKACLETDPFKARWVVRVGEGKLA